MGEGSGDGAGHPVVYARPPLPRSTYGSPTWEYKTVTKSPETPDFEEFLNRQGDEGWELVWCFPQGHSSFKFVFKREA